ncbi:ABC transporter permease subunit [Aquihabitans sp. McL0605]|uniref:ABC transporter permease subunit n=1 Tax=Aquihabitans sp. McL0605 TaxID=3415671 RepID=UPI003CE831EB
MTADGPVDATKVDWAAVRAIVRKDLTAVRRSKAVMLPMLLVPVVLLVLLPLSVGLAAGSSRLDVDDFLNVLPGRLIEPIIGLPHHERLVILVLGYLVAPLFLIVPLMVSAVLASDAFAGEKERKTLETMLHLPVRDKDLYIAKLLVGFLPSVAVSWIGFALFTVVANASAWRVMHRIFMPTVLWAVMILWIAPAVAALGLGIMVRVSIRVNSTQEAQQLGGAVVLPLVILAVAQTTALMLAGMAATVTAGAVFWVIAIWLNVRGVRGFTRDRLAARL